MAKQVKTSSFRAKRLKASRGCELPKDRISELPDAMIVYILSLLTMKEAGRTCVLSKRWTYVWACIPVLNFDGSDTLDNILSGKELFHVEKPRFLRWVNQVVGSYRGPTIDEFRVRFDFSVTSRYSIDNWVKFVMEKRVKRLELDFFPDERSLRSRCYTFHGSLISNYLLTYLKLVSVNVTGKVLRNFLRNCPNLEYLSVKQSKSLVDLQVVTREALKLRYLELCKCSRVEHVEISAPNLVSFTYFGPKIDLPLKVTPKLYKLSMGGYYAKYLISNSLEFSSYLFQLEAFRLDLKYGNVSNVMKYADQFPVCTRLKRLELAVSLDIDGDLICLAKMLRACPFLHKFVLTVEWSDYIESNWFEVEECQYYKLNMWELESRPHYHVNEYVDEFVLERCPHQKVKRLEPVACPHYHLKMLEIVGFVGNPIELQLIIYLMEDCITLEKFVIDPCEPLRVGSQSVQVKEREATARKKAEQLRPKVKPGAELIIL